MARLKIRRLQLGRPRSRMPIRYVGVPVCFQETDTVTPSWNATALGWWLRTLLAGLIAVVAGCRSDDTPHLAVVGGTVLDPMSGSILADATVLIGGERIAEVGPRESVVIPATATVYDARGKWVVPGLMDLHAHPGAYEGEDQAQVLQNLLGFGVTTIRSTHQSDGPRMREELASGRMLGPRL